MRRNRELLLYKKGYKAIVGLDEVGRGALAGPIVAGACILPRDVSRSLLVQLNDSKKLSKTNRELVSKNITNVAIWSVGVVGNYEIDRLGIAKANILAFKRALKNLPNYDYVLVDYFQNIDIHHVPVIGVTKGDALVPTIAAASIVAKVYRDALMKRKATEFPEYGFESHVGYGTERHREAIQKYGTTSIHRKSFIKST
ncbi:MAG: ribonuclease HII [Patescibacteria group bacterium]